MLRTTASCTSWAADRDDPVDPVGEEKHLATTWNGIQVYERLNRDKLQLFAIRDDRRGLGRVFDSRYPQLGCRGEVKFPLGRWKQGEVRGYQARLRARQAAAQVTIEEIDFVDDGVPHSLRFHWLSVGTRKHVSGSGGPGSALPAGGARGGVMQTLARYGWVGMIVLFPVLAYGACPDQAAVAAYVADFAAVRASKGFGGGLTLADAECARSKLVKELPAVLAAWWASRRASPTLLCRSASE